MMTELYHNATHTTRTTIQTSVLDPHYASGFRYEEKGSTLHGYTNSSFPATKVENQLNLKAHILYEFGLFTFYRLPYVTAASDWP
jgi:hypothetical protein